MAAIITTRTIRLVQHVKSRHWLITWLFTSRWAQDQKHWEILVGRMSPKFANSFMHTSLCSTCCCQVSEVQWKKKTIPAFEVGIDTWTQNISVSGISAVGGVIWECCLGERDWGGRDGQDLAQGLTRLAISKDNSLFTTSSALWKPRAVRGKYRRREKRQRNTVFVLV